MSLPATPTTPSSLAERRRNSVRWSDEMPIPLAVQLPAVGVGEQSGIDNTIKQCCGDNQESNVCNRRMSGTSFHDVLEMKQYTPYPSLKSDPFEAVEDNEDDANNDEQISQPTPDLQTSPSKALSYGQHRQDMGSLKCPTPICTSHLNGERGLKAPSPLGLPAPAHSRHREVVYSRASTASLPSYPGTPGAIGYNNVKDTVSSTANCGIRLSYNQAFPSRCGHCDEHKFSPSGLAKNMYSILDSREALKRELENLGFTNYDGNCDPSIAAEAGEAGWISNPHHKIASPLKPALRRPDSDRATGARSDAQQNAGAIVDWHLQHLQPQNGSQAIANPDPDCEKVVGGVLSKLLQLYNSQKMAKTDSGTSVGTSAAQSVVTSRTTSVDSRFAKDVEDENGSTGLHNRKKGRGKRSNVDKDEDALTSADEDFKSRPLKRSSSQSSIAASVKTNTSVNTFKSIVELVKDRRKNRRNRRLSITKHVADILTRQTFVLRLAKALMATGSPSHRLESQLNATSRVLEIDAQFVHLPSIVLAAFGDYETRTSETHFIKADGTLSLGQLHRVHTVYKNVVHDQMSAEDGSAELASILAEDPIYSIWQRVMIAAVCCCTVSMIGFAGSFADALVSGVLGAFLTCVQLRSTSNQMFSNIFEISIATVVSFIARGLSTTGFFCYESLSSAGVTLILPGYTILCGSLELASKNLVAGSVRMVYAIIYALFLGFGIAIGSDLWFLVVPNSRTVLLAQAINPKTTTLTGSFAGLNGTIPIKYGTFTFTDYTSNGGFPKRSGEIQCYRDPSWGWWRQDVNPLWMILLVPTFSIFLSLWNLQPLKSKEIVVMMVIACAGWTCNYFGNRYIFDRSDVVSFLGAFAVGLLGNMYSRIFKGTAFTSMVTGVLFLVPSGISAAGGLSMDKETAGDSYSNGLAVGFRMVQVAIGITVGLFFSSFVVYSLGRGKSNAPFTF